ncbi:hypothetical protein ACHAWF_009261 [Thalassiosira exigua]
MPHTDLIDGRNLDATMGRHAMNAIARRTRIHHGGGGRCPRRLPSREGCERRTIHDDRGRRRRRVVVTGAGAITALGPDLPSAWTSCLRTDRGDGGDCGDDGIASLYDALQQQDLSPDQFEKEWDAVRSLSCNVAASVRSEWISSHPSQKGEEGTAPWNDGRTSRFVQLGLIAAREAVRTSGLDGWLGSDDAPQPSTSSDDELERRRESFGVSVGNGLSSTRDISTTSSLPLRRISPHFVPRILPNSPGSRVAIRHRLLGPNLTHSEACAAGAAAVAHAFELVRSGRAKGMVAGGCESAVDALALGGFGRLRALSSGGVDLDGTSDDRERRVAARASSRPFDARRDGFVLAEGAAMLVLEDYEHAVARGAPILAEVLGVGYSCDAHHITAPESSGRGAARAMLQAVEDAELTMDDVEYVNAHATSTPVGDVAEVNAIRLALSRTEDEPRSRESPASPLLVSSTKGATGHLLGAAGALEAALTILAVSEGTVPHTRNLVEVSEDISAVLEPPDDASGTSQRIISLVRDEPIRKDVRTAMSNSFGFGGTNVCLLFGKVH